MVQIVYPSIRSVWPSSSLDTHSEKTKDALSTNSQQQQSSLLTVTSATIFANGGYAGSKSSMTTFERDAGLYVVHIDLGNEIMGGCMDEREEEEEEEAMGAIFMESLVSNDDDDDDDDDDTENNNNAKQQQSPIVGPLQPGQMILHKSNERTAVLTAVPSDIHELECNALDCKQRTTGKTKFLRTFPTSYSPSNSFHHISCYLFSPLLFFKENFLEMWCEGAGGR